MIRSDCLLAITRPHASGFDCAHIGGSGGAVRYSASGFPSMLAVRDVLDFFFVFYVQHSPGMGVPAPPFFGSRPLWFAFEAPGARHGGAWVFASSTVDF